jgi:hypothetical protein
LDLDKVYQFRVSVVAENAKPTFYSFSQGFHGRVLPFREDETPVIPLWRRFRRRLAGIVAGDDDDAS